jgi:hypothetical protein
VATARSDAYLAVAVRPGHHLDFDGDGSAFSGRA